MAHAESSGYVLQDEGVEPRRHGEVAREVKVQDENGEDHGQGRDAHGARQVDHCGRQTELYNAYVHLRYGRFIVSCGGGAVGLVEEKLDGTSTIARRGCGVSAECTVTI